MKTLYSDKEIGKLIERAYQLQQQDEANQSYGLSVEELQKLAEEMGIQPAYLEKALHETTQLGFAKPKKEKHFWGIPLSIEDEAVVQGEITDEMWEEIVIRLREIYKQHGISEQVGKTRSWLYRTGQSHEEVVSFSISSKNGQSKMKLKEQRYNLKIGLVAGGITFAWSVLLLFIVLFQNLGIHVLWGFLPTIFTLLLSYFGVKLGLENFASEPTKGQQFLKKLARKWETNVPKETVQQATPQISEPQKPLLNLDSLPDMPESQSETMTRNREMSWYYIASFVWIIVWWF